MRSSPALLLFLLFAHTATAQIPIAEARQLPVGTQVTVSGIVTNGSEFGSIRYMQDATAGIAIFPGTGSAPGFSPAPGTQITVTGPLKLFNGLLEIDPVQSFTINSTGNPLPDPLVITPSGIGENTESRLVRINDAQFANGGATFTSTTWTFTSGGQSANVFLRSGHPLIGAEVPVGTVDIVGIVSQFSTSTPPSGGYQLLPRGAMDLIPTSGVFFTSGISQSDIVPDGFTLAWTTNVAGASGVRYGLAPSLGQQIVAAGSTASPAVQLTGLQPATFYYALGWSALNGDTTFSTIGYYSTASAIPGEVLVYFNQSVDHGVATGPLAFDLGSDIDDTIRAYIDRSLYTVDAAVYNTSNNSIVHALNAAMDRGVRVRYIAEGSTNNSSLQSLPQFPVHYRMNSSGSGMHNKFLAIDAADPQHAVTLTGSMNFTNFGFFFDANNLVAVHDQALTRAYEMEFEEMWGSAGAQPNAAQSRFGSQKTDNTPHLFNVNGTYIESRFSPTDGTQARIDATLRQAEQQIRFALFAFTSGTLAGALIDRHNSGVTVIGLLDDAEEGSNIMQQLLGAGVPVGLDNVENSLLHHKYAIVDHDVPGGDPVVITGSHNWSFNAENINDENTLFIHSNSIANQFFQEWTARNIMGVDVRAIGDDRASLRVWPNPVGDLLFAGPFTQAGEVSVRIHETTGRLVMESRRQLQDVTGIALDVRELAAGSYVLVVEQDGARHQRMFIRE